jgi:ABC-type multidrug transport system fused ATPase/permease subunit
VAKYKSRLLIIAALGLIGIVFEVAKPLPVKIVIDNVLANHPLPAFISRLFGSSYFTSDKYQLLLTCISLLLIVAVRVFPVNLCCFNLTVKLAQRLVFDLMIDFFSKLQRLSLSFYTKNQVGDLLQRMSSDVFVVYFLVAQIMLPALISIISLVAMFYIMAKIDLLLAIVAYSVVPSAGNSAGCFCKTHD